MIQKMQTIETPRVVIIGAGLAAVYTALKLAPLPVVMISPEPLGSGASSAWAQGGVAAAMARTPDTGVCDEDLKVFGVENLHLATSAAFPQLAAPAPTLTIAALSLRLAAHLGGDVS